MKSIILGGYHNGTEIETELDWIDLIEHPLPTKFLYEETKAPTLEQLKVHRYKRIHLDYITDYRRYERYYGEGYAETYLKMEDIGLFVHADVPVEDWELLKELVSTNDNHPTYERSIIDMCLWSRDVVYKDCVYIAQVDNVFLGHTVLPEIKQVGNCTFLDTGGVFRKHSNEYKFSIVNLKDYC